MTARLGLKYIRNAVLWDSAFALVPAALLYTLNPHMSGHDLLVELGYCLVYSNCIGGVAFALIPKVWEEAECLPMPVQWFFRVAAMMASCFAGCLAAGLVFVALRWQPMTEYWPQFFGSFKLAAVLTVIAGVTLGVYTTLRERLEETKLELRTKELERERALKLATEAQLASLESRIHPHFLFNALNSISSLIPEDPARAERLVEQMAALLRFSLDANQAGLVPLASELKIVADYLDIEQARFGERLRYDIAVPADLHDLRVPPLAIQTLVENSVKHAIVPDRAGGEIRIVGACSNGNVQVEVSDPGPAFQLNAAPRGHGLDILRGRITTLFGEKATLQLRRVDGRNMVTLSIPQTVNSYAGVSD